MIDVTFDVQSSGVVGELSEKMAKAVSAGLQATLADVRDKWQWKAQTTLHSTRPLYLQGLNFNSIKYPLGNDMFSGLISLQGKLPNMIESGTSAFDEKLGFSKSELKKVKPKGGWYMTIPMRHSTPGSNGTFGNSMPKNIYKLASKLKDGDSLTADEVANLGYTKGISWNGYQHKSFKYEGLTRIVKSYSGKTKQSTYVTFRRVSDKSDPKSWWHPGFPGIHLAKQLELYAKSALENNIQRAISESL